ncbi:MAG: IclR family transcriptional regulator [Deltaproteobacteria bacterium]|nr:IclR family transcriptional regulator [Deltaproteobacteria bacterium]
MTTRYNAPSVRKAFEILNMISAKKEGVGINELARGLKMAKSTVHGITSTLEELGVVIRDPGTKRYSLGFTLFELGRRAYSPSALIDHARPIMENLMEKTDTSVFLGLLTWDYATILDTVESKRDLKITAPVGARIPLLAGAVGKVFLSLMEEEQVLDILRTKGIKKYTENTITDPERHFQEIRRVRQMGYAVDDEEYIPGVRAAAAPIRGEGYFMSAIWAVGCKASLDGDKMAFLGKMTRAAAESIRDRTKNQSMYDR